ncbi:MAG: 2-oxo-4-hydroxy-4-carboxy-5-ureidoimidazoline decarboxylase, partial [Comamonas sp.]
MALTLEQLNAADAATATELLDGLYEHSPWIAAKALEQRPFKSMAHIKHAMAQVLAEASEQSKLDLIRAHPELAGKQMETNTLTAESTNEQTKAGLTNCTPEELEHIRKLNAEYGQRFGFPFILAVRGPRGAGLSKAEIMATFERRIFNHPAYEQAEALRNIHRIAEIRLNDKFGYQPVDGNEVWDWQERLATHSDPGYAEKGQLTVTYLTDAHRACAQRISHWMREVGFDEVEIDAVGNVVGRYKAATEGAKTLLTGSHYDTVRNGGKYDGRLGIFVPMACVQQLHKQGKRLPFNIEVVGFAEEEGQRYKATFLGSGALVGDFKQEWLEQKDADGITLREAMLHAGLCIDDIPKLERDPAKYLGFIEVHIEQGPV